MKITRKKYSPYIQYNLIVEQLNSFNELTSRLNTFQRQPIVNLRPKVTHSYPKVTYSYPRVTYSDPKVTYSDPKVTHIDPTHLPLPPPTSPGHHLAIS